MFPARSGAKLREYHFLRALGQEAEVTYIYFADPEGPKPTLQDLPFCKKVIGIPKPSAYGFRQKVGGVLGRWPLQVVNYTSEAMSGAVAQTLNEADFDFIHLDSIHMVRYAMAAVKQKPGLRAVYNWHNIESEAMRRFVKITGSRSRAWYGEQTAHKLEYIERRILRTACGHIVCSEREREQVAAVVPGAKVEVVENGVDTAYFSSGRRTDTPTPRVVFVGSMAYFPNSDAAVHFATGLWPRIREGIAGAELMIVGGEPGPEVRALGKIPGVTVTGMVPDVRPYYQSALASVVPLRTGGGTRLKILEAMAAGVPVISTPLGAEGLDVRDGANLLLVNLDDVDGWIASLRRLQESASLRDRLTTAGLELVRTHYDWKVLGTKLVASYRRWL